MGANPVAEALVVRLERYINATPERVWQQVSTFDGMVNWLGPKTFEPQLGGRVLFDVLHGSAAGKPQRWLMFGNIAVFEPARELAFTWQEFSVPDLTVWPAPTTVSVSLAPQGTGTMVTLTHSGFEALPDGAAQHKGYAEGWASLNDLAELARLCEDGA
jgi:uncharacterized protein YndB with AHSA1/START domain